jgi:ribosomal protein L30E
MATAISKLARAIWALITTGSAISGVKGVIEVSRETSKCPAIILAVSRMARVRGRIMFLIVSTSTIKGIKIVGVPLGIKCTRRFVVLNSHPCIIKPSQSERAIVNEIDIWEVAVKI